VWVGRISWEALYEVDGRLLVLLPSPQLRALLECGLPLAWVTAAELTVSCCRFRKLTYEPFYLY
jgi:hypothetical protein